MGIRWSLPLTILPSILLGESGVDIHGKIDSAISYFNQKNYEKCYEGLDALFYEIPNDKNYNFYYGRCAFETKRYDESIAAYERALLDEPANKRAKLELARAYYHSGSLIEAKNSFTEVLAENPPNEVKEKINFYLSSIEQAMKKSTTYGSLLFGLQYDTNTNNSHGDKYNLSGIEVSSPNKKSDTSHIQLATINHYEDIGRRDKFYGQIGATGFAQSYFKETDSNLLFGQLKGGFGFKSGNMNYSIPLRYEVLNYGKKSYLNSTGISFVAKHIVDNKFTYTLTFDQKNKEFQQNSDSGKDSKVDKIALDCSYKYENKLFIGSVFTEDEKKDDSSKSDIVDNSMVGAKVAVITPIEGYNVYGHYLYKNYKYDELQSSFNSKRDDKYNNFNVTVDFPVTKVVNGSFSVEHTINSSNQEAYDYTKSLATVNFSYKFVN